MIKERSKTKIDSINPLQFIVNEINEYIEVIKGSEYLTLVSTDESSIDNQGSRLKTIISNVQDGGSKTKRDIEATRITLI